MKRCVALLVLAALVLLAGCDRKPVPAGGSSEPATAPVSTPMATEPLQKTESTEGGEGTQAPSVYAPPPEGSMPMLLFTGGDDSYIVGNYVAWDLENGTLSAPVPWYKLHPSSSLNGRVVSWNGGPSLLVDGKAEDCAPGIQCLQKSVWLSFGPMNGCTKDLLWLDQDGSTAKYDYPPKNVPAEVYDAASLGEVFYATLDGDTMLAAYSVYNSETREGDLVYVTYPAEDPKAAVWKVAHIPFAHAVDVDASWNGVYGAGTLYLPASDAVLALDLESGELEELDVLDRVHALTPEATQDTVAGRVPIRLVGFWDGVLVVSYPQYLPDGTCHTCYVALRDGEIAGMLMKVEDSFTFYDSQLQVIGTDDSYVGKLASNIGLAFARQG